MTLLERQQLFARLLASFILKANELGYEVTIGEVARTKEQAEIYARSGMGILNSLHLLHIAADLSHFKDGKYLTTIEELSEVGTLWESLHSDCRWGGCFHRPDADHFSLTYQGRA